MTADLEAEAAADLALLRAAEAAEPPPWLLDSDGKPYATLYWVERWRAERAARLKAEAVAKKLLEVYVSRDANYLCDAARELCVANQWLMEEK